MTAFNCPVCPLRFATRNERDWHLREEHGSHRIHRPLRTADSAESFRAAHQIPDAPEAPEPHPDREGT
jgi:hypothetical protein